MKCHSLLLIGSLLISQLAFSQEMKNPDRYNPAISFLENFPQLERYKFVEPHSGIYLGFGIAPGGFIRETIYSGLNFFQLHYMDETWDIEVFSASVGSTFKGSIAGSSIHASFRTAPKIKFWSFMSAGPLVGLEYVKFSSVDAKLLKDSYETPVEPFSSQGFFYGFVISETFDWKEKFKFKVSQVYYRQTYSVDKTPEDWTYYYEDPQVRGDLSLIEADDVFLLEFSILY